MQTVKFLLEKLIFIYPIINRTLSILTNQSIYKYIEALDVLAGKIEERLNVDNSQWLTKNSWEIHVNRILSAVSECGIHK